MNWCEITCDLIYIIGTSIEQTVFIKGGFSLTGFEFVVTIMFFKNKE